LLFAGVAATTTLAGEARADNAIREAIGVISDSYGAFQAAQFLVSLFGIGSGSEMQQAIAELKTFMQNYRDQALVNNVTGDLSEFALISSNFMNGLTDDLESDFIGRAINDFSNLQGDIQNGDMTDAYTLGPAFNLLSVTFVGGLKAFGIQNPANAYPQSQLDSYMSQTLQTDYALVGAETIAGWFPSGSDQVVYVNCFATDGTPANSMFTLLFSGASPNGSSAYTYAWASNPFATSNYVPSTWYQSGAIQSCLSHATPAPVNITPLATGVYSVNFPGMPFSTTSDPLRTSNVKVSAYGWSGETCSVWSWSGGASNATATVVCFDASGNPVNSYFTITYSASLYIPC
jgi:hypothetical protein